MRHQPAPVIRTPVGRRRLIAALALLPVAGAAAQAEPAAGFVYVANEQDNSISRIDLATGRIATFPTAVTPHNIQFVPGRNLVLVVGMKVASGGHGADAHGGQGHGAAPAAGQLLVFDAARLAAGPAKAITVGAHPAHVIADTAGERAFVTNSGDNTVSVVDLAAGRVIRAIPTGAYPHGLRMSPNGRGIAIANLEDGSVSLIDTVRLTEAARFKVGPTPVQVAYTPDGKRLYVSLRDTGEVAMIETATHQVTARIAVGRAPIQLYATPDGRFVYVANQGTEAAPDDTVSVIDVARGAVAHTIRTAAGAHGVTISDNGRFVFIANTFAGSVSEISVASQSVSRSFAVGRAPAGITFRAR